VILKVDVNLSNRFGQAVIKISGLKPKNLTTLIEKGASGWDLRVRGSNPGCSRQPLTLGCQKRTSDSQPKTVCLS